MYPAGSLVTCDGLMAASNASRHHTNGNEMSRAYYQMGRTVPPPCYTIATGLPTYDEALHHQHFSFGMKSMYPTITAVHHHPTMSGIVDQTDDCNLITSWEKEDLKLKHKTEQRQHSIYKVASLASSYVYGEQENDEVPPPAYEMDTNAAAMASASVALLSHNDCGKWHAISICMQDAEEKQEENCNSSTMLANDVTVTETPITANDDIEACNEVIVRT